MAPPAAGLGAGLGVQLGRWGCNEALGGQPEAAVDGEGQDPAMARCTGLWWKGLVPCPRCARGAVLGTGSEASAGDQVRGVGGKRSLPGLFAALLKRGIFVLGPR